MKTRLLEALSCMGSDVEQQFWTKSESRRQIWAISAAEQRFWTKSERPARISNTIEVEKGGGTAGLCQIALLQDGLAHRCQILGLGIGPGAIRHRISTGALTRVLPSVLAVGGLPVTMRSWQTAALLFARSDAVLSHAAAAAVWGFVPESGDEVDITVTRRIKHRERVRVHEVPLLDLRDVRLRHGLPVTAPARTLIDFAAVASESAVAGALNEARVLRLVTDTDIRAALDRAPLRPGSARIRAALASEHGPVITRSEAERALRRLLAQAGLPTPQFNVYRNGFLVDAWWPEQRVVLEADGFAVHGRRRSFEADRRRDQVHAAHGDAVLRVTWWQILDEPIGVAARIAAALALRAAGAPPAPSFRGL